MPTRRRSIGLLAALVLSPALVGVGGAVPARAQAQGPAASLSLRRQPAWHEPGDRLDLRLQVRNEGTRALDGFRVFVGAYGRVLSRSELHGSFDEPEGLQIDSFTDLHVDTRVPPGEARIVNVTRKVRELLSTEDEAGVYPLTVSLHNASNEEELDTLTTQLVYYPNEPNEPLNLALVVPLHEAPSRDPSGVFRGDPATGELPLEQALAGDGWLRNIVDTLAASPEGLRGGLAPTPRLIEEVADMADGYVRGEPGGRVSASYRGAQQAAALLDRLRRLVDDAQRFEPMVVPYSYADLPTLTRELDSLEHLTGQLKEGRKTLQELGAELEEDSWLFVPGGRVDLRTLERITALQLDTTVVEPRLVFSSDSLRAEGPPSRSGCPAQFATFACPVTVDTVEGNVRGLVSDEGLQDRFVDLVRPGDARLELQRFFAETAMIREEVPGVAGRVVEATLPVGWRPGEGLARSLFAGVARAPWLESQTPSAALRSAAEKEPRSVVDSYAQGAGEPGADYYEAIREADLSVDRFEELQPPRSILERLTRNVLAAESLSWWEEVREQRGTEYALETESEVQTALDNITISADRKITLTSQSDDVPLFVVNKNPYEVTVRVEVLSPRLDLRDNSLELNAAPEKGRLVRVRVSSSTSGTFPLTARLVTPESGTDIKNGGIEISIQSTQFNRVALIITIGALIFLILFYVLRGMRGRRSPSTGEGTATA